MANRNTEVFSIFRSLEDIDHSIPKGYQRHLQARRDVIAGKLVNAGEELNPMVAPADLACGESPAALASAR